MSDYVTDRVSFEGAENGEGSFLKPYILALEERFGISLDENTESPIELLVDGSQSLFLDFNFKARQVIITTPIEESSGKKEDIYFWKLLAKNFPNNDVAGAIVQYDPEEALAVLVNTVPLRALDPLAIAGIAINQALSAIKLKDIFKESAEHTPLSDVSDHMSEIDMQRFEFPE